MIEIPGISFVSLEHPLVQWMLGCLVFSCFIAIATWRADALLRASGRQTRHVWSAGLLIAVAWSVLAPRLFTTDGPTLTSQIVAPIPVFEPAPLVAVANDLQAPTFSTSEWLVAAWCALSALLFLRLLVAVLHLVQLRRTAERTVVDGHEVLVTDNVGPAVIGGQRGEILIPSWLLEFDAPLRALVFRHEQEHRNARDPFLLWASLLVTALLPWNLPLWWMARRLRLSLEIDCDVRTLAGETDRRRYAQLLLLIAQKHTHVPFASTLAGRESGLAHRISIMLKAPSRNSRTRVALSMMVVVAFVVAACSTRIANLTSPGAEPVASVVAAVDEGDSSAAGRTVATAPQVPGQPYFDFQTEKPATALPGARPAYPEALRAAGVGGLELIQVVVRPDSMADMRTFKVLKSDNPAFTAAVREALPRMKFIPAIVDGRSVSQLVQLPFSFGTSEVLSTVVPAPVRRPDTRSTPRFERGTVMEPKRTADPNAPYFDFQVHTPAMAVQGSAFPQYPEDLRKQRVEGQVLVQFVVDVEGVPDTATFKVLRSDNIAFGEAVRAALPNMRFTPAQLSDGTKVKQLVQQPFGFKVNR